MTLDPLLRFCLKEDGHIPWEIMVVIAAVPETRLLKKADGRVVPRLDRDDHAPKAPAPGPAPAFFEKGRTPALTPQRTGHRQMVHPAEAVGDFVSQVKI